MKKNIIAILINISIFVLTIFGLIVALAGIPIFNNGTKSSLSYLMKFFTVESNMFIGITALVLGINQILYLKKGIKINKIIFIIKYVATVSVAITFFTVLFFLGPVVYRDNFWLMYKGVSFFYHFLIPVLAMVVFIFFESTNEYDIKISFYGMIPFIIYAIFYLIAALANMDGGKVKSGYDWYGFLSFGIPIFILLMIGMVALAYMISFLLYFTNKKMYKK